MYRIGIPEERVKKQTTVRWWKWWWKWRFGIRIVSESDLSSYNNQSESCIRAWTNKRVNRRKCVCCRVISIVSGTRVWSDFHMRVNTRVITSIVKVWGTCIRRLAAASWPDSECGEQLLFLFSCGHWLSVNKYATGRSTCFGSDLRMLKLMSLCGKISLCCLMQISLRLGNNVPESNQEGWIGWINTNSPKNGRANMKEKKFYLTGQKFLV